MIEALEGKALRATQYPEGCSIVALEGAVRSSKTVSELLMWLRYIRTGPSGLLVMVGRTETAVINNLVLPLQEMLGPRRVVLNRGTGTVTIMGRLVQLYGANDEQARTKIQGLTLAGALLDEAANIPESFFNMLRSRLSIPGAVLFLTCNPEGPKHWLKIKWLDRARLWIDKHGEEHHNDAEDALNLFRVTFVLRDNLWLVRNNLPFVEELENSWPKGSMWHLRYIESEWVSADGAVYDLWNASRMTLTSAQIPDIDQVLIAGVDYGQNHPTRGYLLGICRVNVGSDGLPDWARAKGRMNDRSAERYVLVVLDEWAPETATVGQHAIMFEAWLDKNAHWGPPEWIAVDPAALTFKSELYARDHSDVMNAHNAVVPGIQTVQSLLGSSRLFIVADNCPNLVARIPAYMWDTKATERGETRPVKDGDDEVDALRYAVYTSRRYWRAQIPLAPIASDTTEDEAA